jgi:hypothetical protein
MAGSSQNARAHYSPFLLVSLSGGRLMIEKDQRAKSNFPSNLNLIWVVQSDAQNIRLSRQANHF